MTARLPLVLANGQIQQLQAGDSVSGLSVDLAQTTSQPAGDETILANATVLVYGDPYVVAAGTVTTISAGGLLALEPYTHQDETYDLAQACSQPTGNETILANSTAVVLADPYVIASGNVLNIAPGGLLMLDPWTDIVRQQMPLADKGGQVFNAQAYGAKGDGVTDDTAAIQSAINAVGSNGGIVFLPPGRYKISSTLTIGNGSISAVSTANYISLVGTGIGSTAVEMFPVQGSTTLLWYGAAGGTMLQLNGPIAGVRCEGVFFDCKPSTNAAATALLIQHAHHGTFRRLQATNFTGAAFDITAYDAPSGAVIGCMDNHFDQVCTASGSGASAIGCRIGQAAFGNAPHLDVAHNLFSNCSFRVNATAGSIGLQLRFCDNLTLINVLTAADTGLNVVPPSGTGGNLFPNSCTFINCPLQGSTSITGSWAGTNKFLMWPYPTGDGEVVPSADLFSGMTSGGGLFNWSDRGGQVYNVKAYGAKADAIRGALGSITSGQNTFTGTNMTFTNADVGKKMFVAGAGSNGLPLSTTIATVTDATHVVLAANAGATVTNVVFVYGTDDTSAIQSAITALPKTGGIVLLPGGGYLITGTITLGDGTATNLSTKRHVRLVGTGMGQADTEMTPQSGATVFYWCGVGAVPTSYLARPVLATVTPSAAGGSLATAYYYFKVVAYDGSGNLSLSSVETAGQSITGPNGKVTLTWSAVTNATGYRVYYSTYSEGAVAYFDVGNVTTYDFTTTSGATSASHPSTLVQVNGPISGVEVSGIHFAGQGATNTVETTLKVIHAFSSSFERLSLSEFALFAIDLSGYTDPTDAGDACAQGCADNFFRNILVSAGSDNSTGLRVGGNQATTGTKKLGVNNNTFVASSIRPNTAGNAATIGANFRYCDNLHFFGVIFDGDTGIAVNPPSGDTTFPKSISFYNCAVQGNTGISAPSPAWTGTSKLFFWPYQVSDSEKIPPQTWACGIDSTGATFGALSWKGTLPNTGGVTVSGLGTPAAPTVTAVTTGTTTYGYKISAKSSTGETLASTETQIANGAATANNTVTWTIVQGSTVYNVYRTTASGGGVSGNSATTGLLATVTGALTYADAGAAAAGATPTQDKSFWSGVGINAPVSQLQLYEPAQTDCVFRIDTAAGVSAAWIYMASGLANWGGIQFTGASALQWHIGNRGGASGNCTLYVMTGGGSAYPVFSLASSGMILNSFNVHNTAPSYQYHQLGGSARLQSLATPSAPTSATPSPTGSTNYWYWLVAEDAAGFQTLVSASLNVTTGPATLGSGNQITVNFNTVTGAKKYYVLRTTTSITPSGTSNILAGTVIPTASDPTTASFVDTTAAASLTSFAVPARNATADLTVDGQLSGNGGATIDLAQVNSQPSSDETVIANATATLYDSPYVIPSGNVLNLQSGALLFLDQRSDDIYNGCANIRPGRDVHVPQDMTASIIGPLILDSGILYAIDGTSGNSLLAINP